MSLSSDRILKCFLVWLPCLVSGVAAAQVSIEEFIHSAQADYEVRTFENQRTFLNRKTYRLPPLRELEFRYQNQEFLDTRNEYALRISPANPFEMRATSKYYKEVQTSLLFEREVALKEALLDRYYTIIDYVYYTELRDLSIRGQQSLNKQVSLLEQRSASSYFDADDYAKLKVEQLDYEAKFLEYEYELINQVNRIERLYPIAHRRDISWNPSLVLSVNRVKAVVDSISAAAVRPTFVEYQRQLIKVAQSQYNLEKSNINLGFGQLEYDSRRAGENRSPFNVSFGITIPVMNPNKPDMARRRMQLIEAELDHEEAEQETNKDILIYEDKLTRLVNSYSRIEQRIDELGKSSLAQNLSAIKGGDPILIVQFEERLRKLEMLLIKIRNDILITYIEYLAFSDLLQKEPLVNYLSPRLVEIHD